MGSTFSNFNNDSTVDDLQVRLDRLNHILFTLQDAIQELNQENILVQHLLEQSKPNTPSKCDDPEPRQVACHVDFESPTSSEITETSPNHLPTFLPPSVVALQPSSQNLEKRTQQRPSPVTPPPANARTPPLPIQSKPIKQAPPPPPPLPPPPPPPANQRATPPPPPPHGSSPASTASSDGELERKIDALYKIMTRTLSLVQAGGGAGAGAGPAPPPPPEWNGRQPREAVKNDPEAAAVHDAREEMLRELKERVAKRRQEMDEIGTSE